MRTSLVISLLVIACGGDQRPLVPASNRQVAAPIPSARLATLVIAEFAKTCGFPHHITITIDGVVRAAVDATCKPPPIPGPGGIIVTGSESSTFEAPAFEVASGRHEIAVHDAITGLTDVKVLDFPVYGHPREWEHPPVRRLADTVVVVAHDDWVSLQIGERSTLVIL